MLSDHLLSMAMAYDANGNLVRVDELFSQTGTLSTTQTFDDFDRLESVTDRWGQVITYGYDANGNRTSLQAPGQSTSYTFDGLNRLETVTTAGGLTRYTYHPNSRLKGIEYPNGTTATYTFDTANRLSTLEHNFGQLTIASYAYTYDDNGNRTSQTETQVGRDTEHTTYTYDLADRLSSVTYPDQAVVYTHDRAGNRLTESITPSTGDPYSKTYGYNARDHLLTITHSLDAAENVTYTYDAGGNQRTKTKNGTVTTFIPNSRNQIARIEENTLPIGTYTYDYRSLRVEKYTDHRTRYLYDAQSVLQRHDDTQGPILYDYGPDRLLSVTHPSEGRSYYHHDALGSVISQSTETGSLLGQYSYDAWGNRRHEITNESNIFGFTGHETDDESGLIYAKARFYDPDTARFLSHDPVEGDPGRPPSLHRYLYAYQNPTVWVDPTGMSSEGIDDLSAIETAWILMHGGGQQLPTRSELFESWSRGWRDMSERFVEDRVEFVSRKGDSDPLDGVAIGTIASIPMAISHLADAAETVATTVDLQRGDAVGEKARARANEGLRELTESMRVVRENPEAAAGQMLADAGQTAGNLADGDLETIAKVTRAAATVTLEASAGGMVAGRMIKQSGKAGLSRLNPASASRTITKGVQNTPTPKIVGSQQILHNTINLRAAMKARYAEVMAKQSNKERGPVLAGVLDQTTGDIFFGQNTGLPKEIHPILASRLMGYPKDWRSIYSKASPGEHAEFVALNEALLARGGSPDLADFVVSTVWLRGSRRGLPIPRCPHCETLTDGTNFAPSGLTFERYTP